MNFIFPIAFLFNNFAITALMIAMGLAGKSHLAAEIGIVQGATMALFYSFSANARSMILNPQMRSLTRSFLTVRLLLIAPLGVASFYLSIFIADTGWILALAIILRRSVEWISEIHLSDMEFNDDRGSAGGFIVLQALLLFIATGCLLLDTPAASPALLAWALLPLILSVQFVRKQFRSAGQLRTAWNLLLPHFGSTAIIGITVYVFRLLIIIYTGKNGAGDLYTAFAIGGFAGSIFAQVLGPSISLHEERIGRQYFPRYIKIFIYLNLLFGVILLIVSYLNPHILTMTGKSVFFWKAVGFSMIGGVVMVFAQVIRYRLLQRSGENDLFGPDVLINIIILLSIPYLYYLLGQDPLVALYLISAVLAYLFYFSAEKGLSEKYVMGISEKYLKLIIAFLLFIPLFFQLSSGIFHEPSMSFSSGGRLSQLPIPVSAPACLVGIILIGNYKRAYASSSFIFMSFIIMLISTIISTQVDSNEREGKFIFLTQFILPTFAFVLGQIFTTNKDSILVFEKIFFAILAVIVPVQLLFTWFEGQFLLSPYLYLFSIYQHLQYVPVIFVCGYLLALYTLWETPSFKKLLMLYAPIFGLYAAASASMLTIALLISGISYFTFHHWKQRSDKRVFLILLLVLLSSSIYLQFAKVDFHSRTLTKKYGGDYFVGRSPISRVIPINPDQQQKNWNDRVVCWQYYTENILSSPENFFFGHSKPPERARYPSAHNYYLDLMYNFGFLALLPLLVIIGFTLKMIVQFRREIFNSSSIVGLTFVVLFLLFVDNSLKVGLRQPYPGIITFFLWGVLLSRLLTFRQRFEPGSTPN